NHLRAHQAWSEGRVQCSFLNARPVVGSLSDRVFFRMGAETFVKPSATACQTIATRTPSFIAILRSPRSTIVSGGDDALISDDDRAHFAFNTVAAHGSHLCNLHEIRIPARALLSAQFAQNDLIQFFPGRLF